LHLLLFNLFCFCDVESTKICVLGHFHPRLFTSFRNVWSCVMKLNLMQLSFS
jgi:hypothetical protein